MLSIIGKCYLERLPFTPNEIHVYDRQKWGGGLLLGRGFYWEKYGKQLIKLWLCTGCRVCSLVKRVKMTLNQAPYASVKSGRFPSNEKKKRRANLSPALSQLFYRDYNEDPVLHIVYITLVVFLSLVRQMSCTVINSQESCLHCQHTTIIWSTHWGQLFGQYFNSFYNRQKNLFARQLFGHLGTWCTHSVNLFWKGKAIDLSISYGRSKKVLELMNHGRRNRTWLKSNPICPIVS